MIATLRHRTGEEIQERYEILGELGAGAFGTVYRCRDRELDLVVAVKELHVLDDPSTGPDERALALEQFRAEAIHLSQLRHPHIVSGHYQPHAGTWLVCPVCGLAFRGSATCPEHNARPVVVKQRHYLVMEFVGGPDLEQAAQQAGGLLPVRQTVRAAQQVVDALAHIHERGWVHRDIKPENIRLRISGPSDSDPAKVDAVLLDFGIATQSGAAGEFSTRPQKKTTGGGTWGYAPDDPRERLHPDARSDIHALGMTLYRVLSGRDPGEAAQLVEMRRGRPRDFNPRIPPALDELIVRCIAYSPSQRPASARDIAIALAAIDAPAPAASTSSSPSAAPNASPSTSALPSVASAVASAVANSVVSAVASAIAGASTSVATSPNPAPPPIIPFTFGGGETATNLTQLVRLCDKHAPEACDYLFHGDIAHWLRSVGRDIEARRADEIRGQYADKREQGLEAFIQFTKILPPPQLKVAPESIDFGTLWMGQKRAVDVQVANPGRGHLFGMVRSRYSNLSFPATFDGNENVLPIVLDSRGLSRGQYEGDIEVDSSGGEVRVPFRFTIHKRRSLIPFWHVFMASMCGALCSMLARTLPFSGIQNDKIVRWLSPGMEFGPLGDKAMMSGIFALCVWAALTGLFAFEGMRRKSCSLFVSGVLSSAMLGAASFAGATSIVPAIDNALKPLMQPVVHNWPAGAWMLAGGLAGMLYGTLSRARDLTTTRSLHIIAAWVASIVVLYGVLASVLLSMHAEKVG